MIIYKQNNKIKRLKVGVQSVSFYENVVLVQLFDVGFDLFELLFVALLSALQPDGVDDSDVRELLVLLVDLVPLGLEALSDGVDLLVREAVLVHLVLLVQVPDHLVLVVDVLLDLVDVGRSLAVVLLLGPVDGFGCPFRH